MYAVIMTGGKQYRVEEGDSLRVERLDAEEGAEIEFDRVLLVADGEQVMVGTPFVEHGKVAATVRQHGRAKKIKVVKFKRRKNYLRQHGHRQSFTELRIESIMAGEPSDQPSAGEPSVTAGEPSVTAGEPSVTAGEPSVTAGEPSATAGEPSVTAGEPSVTAGEPSVTAGEPSVTAGEPSVMAGEPSVMAGEPSITTDQPSITAGQSETA